MKSKLYFLLLVLLVPIILAFNHEEKKVVYDPPQPKDAPDQIRNSVMLGYNILIKTQKYAADYVGNDLNCHNCHFEGGITKGGKNGGISYVGVAAKYPHYRERHDYAVDLMTRINNCFMRSLKGKPLPGESKEMTALLTYYQWISKGIPIYAEISLAWTSEIRKRPQAG
jgi:thiosulfate dehydrogenase